MTKNEFHNALRIMIGLDLWELVQAAALPESDEGTEEWQTKYNPNPFTWFIRTEDAKSDALWIAMKKRGMKDTTGDPEISRRAGDDDYTVCHKCDGTGFQERDH